MIQSTLKQKRRYVAHNWFANGWKYNFSQHKKWMFTKYILLLFIKHSNQINTGDKPTVLTCTAGIYKEEATLLMILKNKKRTFYGRAKGAADIPKFLKILIFAIKSTRK